MSGRFLSRLRADARGVTAIEFALVAPVLLIAMMGIFDLGHNMYTASLLHGAIQKAARDSTIEGAEVQNTQVDARVTDMVQTIAPGADLKFSRKAYATFSDLGKPEDFTDVNGNGICDQGEPFEDANGNGTWDNDRARNGFGGARDAVLYEVTVTYPRVFPFYRLVGQSEDFTMVARTVLRNQPYDNSIRTPVMGNCP